MKLKTSLLFALAIALALPAFSLADDAIGVVRTMTGSAKILRAGAELTVEPGFKLMQGDRITTGPGSSLGVFMRDDASLSLGADTDVNIDSFRFSPAQSDYSFVTRIVRGTLCYLSGLIGKLSPESAKFETPVASLSIRGTYFAVKVDG